MNIAPLPVTVLALLLTCSALQAFGTFDEAMAEGKTDLDSKGYEEAKGAFTSALELAANSDQCGAARNGLSAALHASRFYEESRKLAEETIEDCEKAPGWPQAHALRLIAESYWRENLTDELKKTSERADSLNLSSGIKAWLQLAMADFYKETDPDAAKAALVEVTEISDLPSDAKAYQAWAFYWLARINKEQGHPGEAVECARKVFELNPPAELEEHAKKLLSALGASEN